jgi:glycosyltransferase involved in cell wall biosynthesis
VLEAFAVGTPVVVNEAGGALYETGVLSGGGLGYRTDGELLTSLRRMVHDNDLRNELAATGYAQRMGAWSESEHIDRYMNLVTQSRASRRNTGPYQPRWARRRPNGVSQARSNLAE